MRIILRTKNFRNKDSNPILGVDLFTEITHPDIIKKAGNVYRYSASERLSYFFDNKKCFDFFEYDERILYLEMNDTYLEYEDFRFFQKLLYPTIKNIERKEKIKRLSQFYI